MKIPKIIHYCWFGPNPIPETEKKCIESWKKFFPDFELKFWNEDTFDFSSAPLFARQAYEHKKYAFVSDYVRLKVLYDYGGIYFDTDVEVCASFNSIINNDIDGFLGFENSKRVGTATMAFIPKHPFIKKFLQYYSEHPFIDKNGNANIIANVLILTDILTEYGLVSNGQQQNINEVIVYPRDWFAPKKINNTDFNITSNTLAIHKFSCSWLSENQKKRGRNWFWLKILRPILRQGRIIGLKIISKEKIHNLEIIIRNKLG